MIMAAPTTKAQAASNQLPLLESACPMPMTQRAPTAKNRATCAFESGSKRCWPKRETEDQRQQSREAQDDGCDTDNHNGKISDPNLLRSLG
jgi:hypothetical protein